MFKEVCCVMCGGKLPLAHLGSNSTGVGAVLCQSAHCAVRHKMLPAAHKCAVCEAPLTVSQISRRYCDADACRLEMFNRSPERLEALAVQAAFSLAEGHRKRSAASRGMPADDALTYRPALVPRNSARVSRLPKERRQAFESHLRSALADGRRHIEEHGDFEKTVFETAPLDRKDCTPAEHEALTQLLAAGCGVCRGRCCINGGTHAFQSSISTSRYLMRHPDDDDEAIISRYMNDIGEITMTDGCVFQGESGCTLDSERRSPTCHQFHCSGLRALYDQWEPGEPVRAYFVQISKHQIAKTKFVDVPLPTE